MARILRPSAASNLPKNDGDSWHAEVLRLQKGHPGVPPGWPFFIAIKELYALHQPWGAYYFASLATVSELAFDSNCTSTRRFCLRPSLVLLSPTSLSLPMPT